MRPYSVRVRVEVRVESRVEGAVRVQPSDVVARDRRSAVGRERCKAAADKNLAVRLHDDDENRLVGAWIETVERGLPRTAAAPPASSMATKNSNRVAFLALDVGRMNVSKQRIAATISLFIEVISGFAIDARDY
jgi:hypothetical protein